MHIQLSAKVINQAEVLKQLHGLTGQQAARAYAKALNDVGFEIRRAMQDEMRVAFDRPTSYIIRSPRVRMAKPDRLSVTIEPAYMGGKGVDPQKILNAQPQQHLAPGAPARVHAAAGAHGHQARDAANPVGKRWPAQNRHRQRGRAGW